MPLPVKMPPAHAIVQFNTPITLGLCAAVGLLAGLGLGIANGSFYDQYKEAIQMNTDPLWFAIGFLGGFALSGVAVSIAVAGTAGKLFHALASRMVKKELVEKAPVLPSLINPVSALHDSKVFYDKVVNQVLTERKEVAKYKQALGQYADPSVVEKMGIEQSAGDVPSKKAQVAVYFSDIRGFTAMSEALRPEQVVSILNDHFRTSIEAIHKYNGKVNKFIGDAVMAIFEEPDGYVDGGSAAQNAVNAAMEAIEAFHKDLPKWKADIRTPFESDLGVGVHYGIAILGNLGSPERREYTAIGDTVNFSSRLCSKAQGGQLLVSQAVMDKVETQWDGTRQAPITVKGKAGEFTTYVVSGKKTGWGVG